MNLYESGTADPALRATLAALVMQGALVEAAGVREGDVLAGKYRVERVLGVGGMGVVVAAHHIHLDERVAIKFLLRETLESRDAVNRFLREARAAVKIKSEYVARVLDVGTLETGAPYMVMEFLEGSDLAAWLRQHGPLPIDQAVEFVLQACVSLAEAHSLGIVHRDLKPSNLFCIRRPDGQLVIKVLDFGISKFTGGIGSAGGSTKSTALLGSPFYMSPEQMSSAKDVDARSDIWALGVILFELLAGSVPFPGQSITEVAIRVATCPPGTLKELRPDVPESLQRAIAWSLEKDRRLRPRNVAELAVALAEFAPARARSHVERITGTLESAGRAAVCGDVRPPEGFHEALRAPPTMAAVGATMAVSARRKRGVLPLAVSLMIVLAAGSLLARHVGCAGVEAQTALAPGTAAASAQPFVAASDSPPPIPSAELAPAEGPASRPSRAVTAEPAGRGSPLRAAGHAPAIPMRPAVASGARPFTAPTPPPPAPTPPAPLAATATEGPNCSPPFFVDPQGNQVFKKECVKKR